VATPIQFTLILSLGEELKLEVSTLTCLTEFNNNVKEISHELPGSLVKKNNIAYFFKKSS
jgi:hypothetical protein